MKLFESLRQLTPSLSLVATKSQTEKHPPGSMYTGVFQCQPQCESLGVLFLLLELGGWVHGTSEVCTVKVREDRQGEGGCLCSDTFIKTTGGEVIALENFPNGLFKWPNKA